MGCKSGGDFQGGRYSKDGEQIAMWAPERGSFSIAKAGIPILDSCNSLKRISLKEDVVWKGDVNLVNLESYDKSIKLGEDILVMQGSQCIGSARASAPAGVEFNTRSPSKNASKALILAFSSCVVVKNGR